MTDAGMTVTMVDATDAVTTVIATMID
jgi:hypothetical protein